MRGRPMFIHCCHCRDCQQQTGSAFAINGLIEAERIALVEGAPKAVAMRTESGRRTTSIVAKPASRHCGAITAGGAGCSSSE